MAIRQGRCTNFGNCATADKKQIVQIPEGADFACPECARALTEMTSGTKSGSALKVPLLAGLLLLIVGGAVWWIRKPSVPVPADVFLRLSGSNTIGSKLAPALAQEFLKQKGATDITVIAGAEDEQAVKGTLPGTGPVVIQIAAHGSATAFESLAKDACDIGMASRKIKPDEMSKLSSLGDMTSQSNEHVLGLDGIAVIVNVSNPVHSLTKEQLAGIFSGQISDWAMVGGRGNIKVYARDDKSGTYDSFKSLVLGGKSLTADAKRYEDSNALSDAVASDANGIGFIGLPYVRNARAIAVSEKGAMPLQPSRFTVATEDYPLSRRLYLYTAANPQNRNVRDFVDFALSKAGQDVVSNIGFIAQNVVQQPQSVPGPAPTEYANLTRNAERLSLNFRFRTGSSELDNKAVMDLDRVVSFLGDLRYSGDNILLFGFADSTGSRQVNCELSSNRANVVQDQFRQRGVKPSASKGFCSDLPVAANDTEEGREKNRRVEIWIKK